MIKVPLTSLFVEGFDEKPFFSCLCFKRVLGQNFSHEEEFDMDETERGDETHCHMIGSARRLV